MRVPILLACAPLALVCSCSQPPASADPNAVLSEIHAVEEAQVGAFSTKDIEGGLAPYAESSAFIASGTPYMDGLAAIRPGMEAMLADPNAALEMTPKTSFVSASGDLAVTVSDYVYTHSDSETGQAVAEKGVNQTVWRKQADGSWKNVSDFNISLPQEGIAQ